VLQQFANVYFGQQNASDLFYIPGKPDPFNISVLLALESIQLILLPYRSLCINQLSGIVAHASSDIEEYILRLLPSHCDNSHNRLSC
jgi:hypothetical protein